MDINLHVMPGCLGRLDGSGWAEERGLDQDDETATEIGALCIEEKEDYQLKEIISNDNLGKCRPVYTLVQT